MSGTPTSAKRWAGSPVYPLNSTASDFLDSVAPESENPREAEDTCMDMDGQSPAPTDQPSDALDPFSLTSDPAAVNLADRVPTPIQPRFRNQVRGGAHWEASDLNHPNGVNNMGDHQCGLDSFDQSVPRTTESEEWNNVRNRRLPSPISEGEDGSSNAGLDGGFTTHLADRLASQVSISSPEENPGVEPGMPVPIDVADVPTTPPQSRRGHIRSRHTINSWTWQPGMKKTFSMGYRTDCEKCRLKVPGHFNHIIIS